MYLLVAVYFLTCVIFVAVPSRLFCLEVPLDCIIMNVGLPLYTVARPGIACTLWNFHLQRDKNEVELS